MASNNPITVKDSSFLLSSEEDHWWVEAYVSTHGKYHLLPYYPVYAVPCFHPQGPVGHWIGPFHCEECAKGVAVTGQPHAEYMLNHGTEDEKFCAYLGGC